MVIVFLVGCIFGISILSFVIIVSYIIYKICNNISYLIFNKNKSFFNQYNKKCKKILNKYGDCKIKKIYIIRESIALFSALLFNFITLFYYNTYMHRFKDQDHFNYHGSILLEISTKTGSKFIKLEKQNSIMMYDTFYIDSLADYMEIYVKPNKKYTLNTILNKTRERIGDTKFYNWDYFNNNCQQFVKEILISMKCFKKNTAKFIIRDMIIKCYKLSDFSDYVLNCLVLFYNFIDKYIIDNLFII